MGRGGCRGAAQDCDSAQFLVLNSHLSQLSQLSHLSQLNSQSMLSHLQPAGSAQSFSSFSSIYPSQRQNLLPTLEILIQNFENFQIFKILEKKFPNSEFFSKISKTTKGPPLTSKGPPHPHYPITKFSFFQEFPKLGVYNIKHNLTRSCFQFWLSKSAPRVTKFKISPEYVLY